MDWRNELDCAECPACRRCWNEPVTANTGFVAHRMKPLAGDGRLIDQGARFEAPFIVTGGCVAVTELLDDGEERIVAFRVPGDLLGIESWQNERHRYGARAVGAATVCRMRWDASGIAGRPAALSRALLAKVAVQLDRATRIWPGLPAARRVRHFTDDFAARCEVPPSLTRAQIGRHLGIAEETVVRALSPRRR